MNGESRSQVKVSEPPSRIPPRGPIEANDEMTNDNFENDENSPSFQGPLYHTTVNLEVDITKKNETVSIPKPLSRPVPSIHKDIEVSEQARNYSIAEPPSRPPPRRPLQDES